MRVLPKDVTAGRRDMRSLDLEERTGTKAHAATPALLEELGVPAL